MARYFALVPAAGAGARFGGATPKQYLQANGRPLLWYAIACLSAHPSIERVFVILRPVDMFYEQHPWQELGERIERGRNVAGEKHCEREPELRGPRCKSQGRALEKISLPSRLEYHIQVNHRQRPSSPGAPVASKRPPRSGRTAENLSGLC